MIWQYEYEAQIRRFINIKSGQVKPSAFLLTTHYQGIIKMRLVDLETG
jgi:hypothetical protein